MACGDFVWGCRCEQPSCKKVFTSAGPGRRQQLKERTFAEQIEIFRIDVAGIAEAFARFPPLPILLYPSNGPPGVPGRARRIGWRVESAPNVPLRARAGPPTLQRPQPEAAATTPRSRLRQIPKKPGQRQPIQRPAVRCRCGGTAVPGSGTPGGGLRYAPGTLPKDSQC